MKKIPKVQYLVESRVSDDDSCSIECRTLKRAKQLARKEEKEPGYAVRTVIIWKLVKVQEREVAIL